MRVSAWWAAAFAALAALAAAGAGCARAPKSPPPVLEDLESSAEDILDLAAANPMDGADSLVRVVEADWQSYRPQAERDGAPAPVLEGMDRAVSGLRGAEVRNDPDRLSAAANEVTRFTPEFLGLYHTEVPPEVGQLDYLGRAVELDARVANFAAADGSLTRIRSIWNKLRPRVADQANGEPAAAGYDLSVEAMTTALRARDAALLEDAATQSLETVDRLEQVFRKSDAGD